MTIQLITVHYGDMPVLFQTDAFINATEIAKQFNKVPKDFLRTESTKDYIKAIGQICLIDENQIVISKVGSSENGGGTWLHPKLAVAFARWLDARFAVWCDLQIEKILHSNTAPADLPEFLKPITEPIMLEDFKWRHQVITNAFQNLKNATIVATFNGSELLVGKRLVKSKRLF
jgi:hypothetical protein